MTRTDALRIAKYTAKVTPTTVGLKIAARLPGMVLGYAPAANAIQAMEAQTLARLDANGIKSIMRGAYYAFARELWKRKELGGNPALDADAQIIKDKWEDRGLTDAVLINIAIVVFGITVT